MRRSPNEGSIRERKDGLWEVRVTAGIDYSTGKRKRISYYANTQQEAVKILNAVDFDDLCVKADSMEKGMAIMQSAILGAVYPFKRFSSENKNSRQ